MTPSWRLCIVTVRVAAMWPPLPWMLQCLKYMLLMHCWNITLVSTGSRRLYRGCGGISRTWKPVMLWRALCLCQMIKQCWARHIDACATRVLPGGNRANSRTRCCLKIKSSGKAMPEMGQWFVGGWRPIVPCGCSQPCKESHHIT